MAKTFTVPIGLAVVTSAERDALDSPSDGWMVWNSDDRVVQIYDNGWEDVVLDPAMTSIIEVLALEIGRIRSALRFLDVEPELFDPEMR